MFKQTLRRFTSLAAVLALTAGVFMAIHSAPAQAQSCLWAGCDAPCEACAWCPDGGGNYTYICGYFQGCCPG